MRYTRLMDDFSSANGDIPVLGYAGYQSRRSRNRWWQLTDLERALLIGLAGLGFFIVTRHFMPERGCRMSKRTRAAADIRRSGAISYAIKHFKYDFGRYPNQLNELLRPPPTDGVDAKAHPYLELSQDLLIDPWGNHYQFLCPAQRSKEDFDLWSCGPNGVCGDADDISNW